MHSLYCTLILPYVNYSIIVWGNTYHSYIEKIFKLQKWAVRTFSNSHYRSHSAPLFQSLNILNIYDTYKLEVGVFMFRNFTNQLPNGFHDSVSKQDECHKYLTRNANDYNLTRNKKVFSDQTVRTSGPILWNLLHQTGAPNLKMSKTVKHFRNQLKNYLISQYYYYFFFFFGLEQNIYRFCFLIFCFICLCSCIFPFNLFYYSFYSSVS